jgi:hypothetical protein
MNKPEQETNVKTGSNQTPILTLLSICFRAGFLVGLFFGPEDGGDMFHRKACWLSTNYTLLYVRR